MNKFFVSKVRLISVVLVLSISALALTACGGSASSAGGPTVVHATLSEFKIELDRDSIPTGPVTFVIENKGMIVHEFVLEAAGSHDEPFALDGKESEVEDIATGSTVELQWTITEPGEYQLVCYVEGHSEAGMIAKITVTAP
jgi:uncharacterized cupredoxin-like copper-binding protein